MLGLFQLLGFFREATGYVRPDDDAVRRAGSTGERHSGYHRKIVWISGVLGALFALAGLAASIAELTGGKMRESDAKVVLLAPLLAGVAGIMFGVAVACLFAPSEFLTGPMGAKWMSLIGTKNILVARIVCFVFGMLMTAGLITMGVLTLLGK